MADSKLEALPAEVQAEIKDLHPSSLFCDLSVDDWENQRVHLESMREKLPRLVWQSAGICREQSSLENAIATVESWRQEFSHLPLSQFFQALRPQETANFNLPNINQHLRLWAETHNLLDVAYLILKSAAFRTESRGGHYRLDYPQSDSNWQVHTNIQNHQWWKSI
jgi:L-aspartate oxidase